MCRLCFSTMSMYYSWGIHWVEFAQFFLVPENFLRIKAFLALKLSINTNSFFVKSALQLCRKNTFIWLWLEKFEMGFLLKTNFSWKLQIFRYCGYSCGTGHTRTKRQKLLIRVSIQSQISMVWVLKFCNCVSAQFASASRIFF